MKKTLLCAVSAFVLAWPCAVIAQQPAAGNLEKLSGFKTTGTPMDIPHVPQGGSKAEAIKRNLAQVKLPAGFKIGLYAIVPDARHMAIGPSTGVVFVGTRKSKLWAVTDRDKDRVADEVKEFAPSIELRASPRRVLLARRFPLRRRAESGAGVPGGRVLVRGTGCRRIRGGTAGRVIAAAEKSYNTRLPHRPDGKLNIALGHLDVFRRTNWTSAIRSAGDIADDQ